MAESTEEQRQVNTRSSYGELPTASHSVNENIFGASHYIHSVYSPSGNQARNMELSDERRPLLVGNDGLDSHLSSVSLTQDGRSSLGLHSCEIIPDHRRGMSWTKAVFIIVNSALGAGMLNFPRAFHDAGGLVSGNLVHLIFFGFALGSLIMIGNCAKERQHKTFQDVISSVCSPGWGLLSSILTSLYCLITCITLIVLIGDQFDRIFASFWGRDFCHHWFMNRQFTMVVSSIFLIVPSCFKRMERLKMMSYVGVVAVWYIAVMIVVEYYADVYPRGPVLIFDVKWTQIFDVVPTICFGYQCHISIVPIQYGLKENHASKYNLSCVISMLVCALVYIVAANYGYLTFGSGVDGDIMMSYNPRRAHVLIGVILLGIKAWATFPILLICVREAINDMYIQYKGYSLEEADLGEKKRRKVTGISLWALSILLAVLTPNFTIVIKVSGCLATAFIFIFPGMCQIQMALFRQDLNLPDDMSWKNVMSIGIGCLYVVLGIFAFGLALVLGVEDSMKPTIVQPLCK